MVSELGECIPCFPDIRGRFGATGSDLGKGMRKFVKAKRILISPEPVHRLTMCVLSQNPTYIQYIFKYIKYIHTYIHTHISILPPFVMHLLQTNCMCFSTVYLYRYSLQSTQYGNGARSL